MGKYSPLQEYLAKQGHEYIPMTFADIEKVLATALPDSKKYPAWWSNNPSNNVMTKEWLAAGYQTESVDIAGERLVFRRIRGQRPPGNDPGSAPKASPKGARHPAFGCLKGTLTIP